MNLEKEVTDIKARNKRVEADKAWETSWSRKIVIAVLFNHSNLNSFILR